MKYQYNDGGRGEAGFVEEANDCVARAIAIAADENYTKVYNRLAEGNASQPRRSRGAGRTLGAHSACFGINTNAAWFKVYMTELGFEWMASTLNGKPVLHLRADELPMGRIIVQIAKHMAAVLDGVLYDTYDSGRDGKVGVTGYWILRKQASGAERILDKVHKLLALSKDNPSEHEAALASERAHELLAAHNLSMADALAHGQAGGDTDRISDTFATIYRDFAIQQVWDSVARANYCELVYTSPDRDGRDYTFTFIGRRINIAIAAMMADYLSQTMLRLAARAVEDNRRNGSPQHGKTVRKDFMLGMSTTLGRRLWQMRKAEMEAAPAPTTTGTSLALWNNDETKANRAHRDTIYPSLRRQSYSPSVMADSSAYSSGKVAGERISLDRQLGRSTTKAIK